jgi:hypothetical protein
MKTTSIVRAMLLIYVVSALVKGQQTVEPKDETTNLLSRKIGWVNAHSTDAVFALQMDLGNAQLPGGISVARNCGVAEPEIVPAESTTLQAELERIVKVLPDYQWSLDDGVFNFLPKSYMPSPLDINISEFKVENVPVLDAYNQLFALPEVENGFARLGLHEPDMLVGSILVTPPDIKGHKSVKPEPKRITLNMLHVTLREALNAIVRADGRKAWLLSVYSCKGNSTYQRVLVN